MLDLREANKAFRCAEANASLGKDNTNNCGSRVEIMDFQNWNSLASKGDSLRGKDEHEGE